MKIYVQRKVEVWVSDIYDVDNLSEETIQDAIDYKLDCFDSETLYETIEDLGPIEVFDDRFNKIYTNEGEYPHECFDK